MSEAAECGRVAVWLAGLCTVAFGSVLLATIPRHWEGFNVGLASGTALGMFVALAWHVSTACRLW